MNILINKETNIFFSTHFEELLTVSISGCEFNPGQNKMVVKKQKEGFYFEKEVLICLKWTLKIKKNILFRMLFNFNS